MNPIRICIADDDAGMRALLTAIVEKAEAYELAGVACDGNALMELYEKEKPQVVVMDVEMPGKTGVECARLIQDRDPRCVLVFVTAHEKYMGDAFQVYAFDYLLKPFPVDRALRTLALAAQRIGDMTAREERQALPPRPALPAADKPTRIMLKSRDGVSFVDMEDILLVQREDRQTVLYCLDGRRYVTSEPLGDMEEKLDPARFFRSHKSYIINLDHIDSISPYGRWTYVVTLRGTERDALITSERFEELKQFFS